jgi:hypothetical protein
MKYLHPLKELAEPARMGTRVWLGDLSFEHMNDEQNNTF